MKAGDCSPIKKEILPKFESVAEFLKSRRSIRAYVDNKVNREILLTLMDVARYAPSGSNSQPVHWLLIEDTEEVRHLAAQVIDWMRSMVKENPGDPSRAVTTGSSKHGMKAKTGYFAALLMWLLPSGSRPCLLPSRRASSP